MNIPDPEGLVNIIIQSSLDCSKDATEKGIKITDLDRFLENLEKEF